MKIKERAKKYADDYVVGDAAITVDLMHKVAEESYFKGAIGQKKIDINKACEFILSDGHIRIDGITRREFIYYFRKAMKE